MEVRLLGVAERSDYMDAAEELGTENRMCIVHAWASAVRTVHEEYTAYPGASDL